MTDALPLCALDLRPRESAFRLAPALEEAGYHRYWVAEHQPQPQPLLLAALVAGTTTSIRVGTAGVLLHYYPPSRTAFDFQFLEDCFPGRIDAGVCAGMIGVPALALDQLDGRDARASYARYHERLAAFVHTLRNETPPVPGWSAPPPPEIWVHASGARSCELAARLGARLGYALFFAVGGAGDDTAPVERYRDTFDAGAFEASPHVAVAVAGVCAETDAQAQAIAAAAEGSAFRANVVGSPATCRERIEAIAWRYRADEIVFADLSPRFEQRLASFALLARAMGGARSDVG